MTPSDGFNGSGTAATDRLTPAFDDAIGRGPSLLLCLPAFKSNVWMVGSASREAAIVNSQGREPLVR
jgi:hypothetical protein